VNYLGVAADTYAAGAYAIRETGGVDVITSAGALEAGNQLSGYSFISITGDARDTNDASGLTSTGLYELRYDTTSDTLSVINPQNALSFAEGTYVDIATDSGYGQRVYLLRADGGVDRYTYNDQILTSIIAPGVDNFVGIGMYAGGAHWPESNQRFYVVTPEPTTLGLLGIGGLALLKRRKR
jgi:hypothetical protein